MPNIGLRHSQTSKRLLWARFPAKIVKTPSCVACRQAAQRHRHARHRARRGARVELGDIRKDDRMNIGMRQIERTPKRVANLMMEAHANHAECRDGEPSAIERRRAAADVVRSEEHTSELQSLMRISYAVFCLQKKTHPEFILTII